MGQKAFRLLFQILTAVVFFTAVFFAGRQAAVGVDGKVGQMEDGLRGG